MVYSATMNLTMSIKSNFFDRAKVQRAVDKGRRKALSKAGAFVRQRAKTSIRKRKKISSPGSPPSSHVGLLRKFMWFAYDKPNDSVVVGPVRLNGTKDNDAPHTLEFGGSKTLRKPAVVRLGMRSSGKRTLLRLAAGTRMKYEPRPYMRPALEHEAPKFAKCFRGVVRE